MKKILFLAVLPFLVFASSSYEGTYICNQEQQVTITKEYLYIGNASFKYNSSRTNVVITDIYLYKTDAAFFVEYRNEPRVYSLNIRNLQDKTVPPYVGRCKKFNK